MKKKMNIVHQLHWSSKYRRDIPRMVIYNGGLLDFNLESLPKYIYNLRSGKCITLVIRYKQLAGKVILWGELDYSGSAIYDALCFTDSLPIIKNINDCCILPVHGTGKGVKYLYR